MANQTKTTPFVHCNLAQIAQERNMAYLEVCREFLEDYVNANGRKEEIERTLEFKQALRSYIQFNCEIQRRSFFGQKVVEGLREEFSHGLYERVMGLNGKDSEDESD